MRVIIGSLLLGVFFILFPSRAHAQCVGNFEFNCQGSQFLKIDQTDLQDNEMNLSVSLKNSGIGRGLENKTFCFTVRDRSEQQIYYSNGTGIILDQNVVLDGNGSATISIQNVPKSTLNAYVWGKNLNEYDAGNDPIRNNFDQSFKCGENTSISISGVEVTPEPTSSVPCLKAGDACLYDASKPETGYSSNKPVCDISTYRCYEDTSSVDIYGKNVPTNISALAKQLAGNCGQAGASCCDPDLQSLAQEDPQDISGRGTEFFGVFVSFVKGIWDYVVQDIITSSTSVAENQTPCGDTLQLELDTTNDGIVIAENLYQPPDKEKKIEGQYTIKKIQDCEALKDDMHIYISCKANPEYEKQIPKSQVKVDGCFCRDPNAPNKSPLEGSVNQDFGIPPEVTQEQTCLRQVSLTKIEACRECYKKKGSSYQPFLTTSDKCTLDGETADANLLEYIKSPPENNRSFFNTSDTTIAQFNTTATGNSNVLGSSSIAVCSAITDAEVNDACLRCVRAGEFWNRAGCTAEELASGHISNLCRAIEKGSAERAECEQCARMGGIATGIGCIYPDLKTIIENQIFGFGLGLSGVVSLFCIIFATFQMQTSGGDPEKIKKAQELITSCITGLIIVIFAVVILRVIGVDILRIPGLS